MRKKMMSEWNKIILTPQEFHDKIIKLASIIPKDKYKFAYGIPRGGLIIAVYLSHYLNLEILKDLREVYLDSQPIILVADDVADTGETLKWFEGYDSATIHYKPRSIVKPTYFVEECLNSDWITYPYEKIEEIPNRKI